MKILLCIRSYWFFKNTSPLLKEALQRGSEVTLMITSSKGEVVSERDRLAARDVEKAIEAMLATYPRLEVIWAEERADSWKPIVDGVRRGIDLAHLCAERYDGKQRLRKRAVDRAPRTLAKIALRAREMGRLHRFGKLLRRADAAIPPEDRMVELLRRVAPDVLVLTPLVDLGCNQNEILRAAEKVGVPTLFLVHSWDNLSMKSPLRCRPTRMVVWNRLQQDEAVEYHGYPRERVAMAGVPHFDEWRDRRPKRGRTTFLQDAQLDPDQPLLVYLCSTTFDSRTLKEQDFVKRWLKGLRENADPALRNANVIVRVHPQRVHVADEFVVPEDGAMIVWPKRTTAPVGEDAKDDYISSLAHADAVIGINTTGMVEAAFLGRPVFTILGTEFKDSQDGTFHFNYLVNDGAGMIRAATSFPEHYEQLSRAVSGSEPFSTSERAYVEMFTHPQGDQTSTSRQCDVVEETAQAPRAVARPDDEPASRVALAAAIGGLVLIQGIDQTRRLSYRGMHTCRHLLGRQVTRGKSVLHRVRRKLLQ